MQYISVVFINSVSSFIFRIHRASQKFSVANLFVLKDGNLRDK